MTNNIDKLADSDRSHSPPREKFKANFLTKRPRPQWPAYIDETAKDIATGIGISDTGLDKINVPQELGPLYKQGLIEAVGSHSDVPGVLEEEISDEELGEVMFLLNRLNYEISHSDTGLENIQKAISSVLEKLLAETTEARIQPHLDAEANSTAELMIQLFSDPLVASQSQSVVEQFEDAYHQGLLARLDEPQMMTPLWEHQRTALDNWIDADFRGFADMATATGKTVLGLAALASRYGSLHPIDDDIDVDVDIDTTGKADVLIVAHNDLILEQWRREFDRHLNIPPERTHRGDDVSLTWGTVHFRTAQTMMNQDIIDYDLVILDEAHHYANGTGWGQLLQEFDNDVLALSGSVDTDPETDSELRERFQSTIGPEIAHYTVSDAQQDGIIPTFEWGVEYAPIESTSEEFIEVTEKSRRLFSQFRTALEEDELSVATDRRLRTFEDIRQFSHTSEGKTLKQESETFHELTTTLFSRRTQRWNQSPALDAVVDLVNRHSAEKVVVLTSNNAQVSEMATRIRDAGLFDDSSIHTIHRDDESAEQRDTVDAFDDPDHPSVLIGTGDLIGEGVDMQHASVAINLATGGVNKQLIQRIGRVLRNPDGEKEATFINVVGVHTEQDGRAAAEDGMRLIEDAHQFRLFGKQFPNDPWFAAANDAVSDSLTKLVRAGHDRIRNLAEDGCYEWPRENEELKTLLDVIDSSPGDSGELILQSWGSHPPDNGSKTTQDGGPSKVTIRIADSNGRTVSNAFVSISGPGVAAHDKSGPDGEVSFRVESDTVTVGVRHPDAGITGASIDTDTTGKTETTINLPHQP